MRHRSLDDTVGRRTGLQHRTGASGSGPLRSFAVRCRLCQWLLPVPAGNIQMKSPVFDCIVGWAEQCCTTFVVSLQVSSNGCSHVESSLERKTSWLIRSANLHASPPWHAVSSPILSKLKRGKEAGAGPVSP